MNWFTPKCPVDGETKDWLEDCFLWFFEEFGETSFRESKLVLPTEEFIPELFSPGDNPIKDSLRRVCGFMNVEYESVRLRIFDDEEAEFSPHPLAPVKFDGKKACGLYSFENGKHKIAISTALLKNPVNLVATIAHELAHAKLLGGEEDFEYDEESEELLTDLATIFFGFGIFTANSLFKFEQWTNSSFQGWQMSREGYITEEQAGYALALYAYLRNDFDPAWAKFLEVNTRTYFKQGIKYLKKTDDTKLKNLDFIKRQN